MRCLYLAPHAASASDLREGVELQDPASVYDQLVFPPPPAERPYVYINMVATVDGKTTLGRGSHRGPIGSPVDRAVMGRLRVHADAVLRGAGTVRHNPSYPGVRPELEGLRTRRGLPPQPLACVVSRRGELAAEWPFFRQAPRPPVVFLGAQAPAQVETALAGLAQVWRAPAEPHGDDGVGVGWMLQTLRRHHGVRYLLCEGGPTLNFALVQAGCVDELFVTVTPILAGHREEHTLVDGPSLLQPFPRLNLISAFVHEGELFLRYAVSPAGGDGAGAPQAGRA